MANQIIVYVYLASLLLGVRTKDPPTIILPGQGSIIGKEVLITRQRATVYLGIPYAAPPIGHLRFSPPQTDPLPSWTEIRNASIFPNVCMQSSESAKMDKLFAAVSAVVDAKAHEDCLYLNIYVPDGSSPTEGWPVMVWLHSGDFSYGSTAMWDGSVLAIKQKVIVVTVAYRLNIFGFFALTDGHASGNYGLLDQVAALDWIQAKISLFGGSPADVCLFGHGAGADSVALHVVSPLSANKFARAIAMSGSAVNTLKDAADIEKNIQDLGERFICDTASSQLLECLRHVDSQALVTEATSGDLLSGVWGPVLDRDLNTTRPFLNDDPVVLLEKDAYNHVNYLTGFTDMEAALTLGAKLEKGVEKSEFEDLILEHIKTEFPENAANDSCQRNHEHLLDTVLFYYSPQPPSTDAVILRSRYMDFATEKNYASGVYLQATHTSKSMSAFVYRFDYKAKSLDLPEWVKVPHQFELPFVWGMPYWPSLTLIWNGADRKMADTVMSLWANFAKTGNTASQTGLSTKWDTFTALNPVIMILDSKFHMTDPATFDNRAFDFWNSYYPKVAEASTVCCNQTSIGTSIKVSGLPSGAFAILAIQYLRS